MGGVGGGGRFILWEALIFGRSWVEVPSAKPGGKFSSCIFTFKLSENCHISSWPWIGVLEMDRCASFFSNSHLILQGVPFFDPE